MIKIKRLEHVGIAVGELAGSNKLFSQLLGVDPYKMEEVRTEDVKTSFFRAGETKIELLEGTDPDSAISRFLDKKGPGIHHLAFEVEDIRVAHTFCLQAGLRVLNPEPKKGADNKLIFFVHPKDTGGVLIEFCQEIPWTEEPGAEPKNSE